MFNTQMQDKVLGCAVLHSSHSVFKRLIHGYCFQILLWVAVQNQIGVLQRSVVDKQIKLRSLIHIVRYLILNRNGINSNHGAV